MSDLSVNLDKDVPQLHIDSEWCKKQLKLAASHQLEEMDWKSIFEYEKRIQEDDHLGMYTHILTMFIHKLRGKYIENSNKFFVQFVVEKSEKNINEILSRNEKIRSELHTIARCAYIAAVGTVCKDERIPISTIPIDCPWKISFENGIFSCE